jgi:Fe-S cluster assembly iron-binding protein IscA
MLTLTDGAVKRLKEHLSERSGDHGIRIFVAGGG